MRTLCVLMMSNLRQNSWFRFFIEGVVIVASILLAFGIEAWWDQRNQQSEEKLIINGLHDQFTSYRDLLNRTINTHNQRVTTIEDLLTIIQQNQWHEKSDRIDTLLGFAMIPGTLDLGRGVLESVINSGRIGSISDVELRLKLVRWQGVLDELQDDEIVIKNLILERILPNFTAKELPMGGVMEIFSAQEWPISKRTLEEDVQKLNSLFTDPEFEALLEVLLGFKLHSGIEYERTLMAIEEILKIL